MIVTIFLSRRLLFSPFEMKALRKGFLIALGGLSLSIALFIFILALTNGFTQKTLNQILRYEPHLMLFPKKGFESEIPKTVKKIHFKHITSAEAYFVEKIIVQKLNNDNAYAGALYMSAGPARKNLLAPALLEGRFHGLVIGKALADENDLKIGDGVKIYFPFKKKEMLTRIGGIAQFGVLELDRYYTYHASALLPYTAIEIRLDQISNLPVTKGYLERQFGNDFYIRSAMEVNSNLFSIVNLIQLILMILLSLTALICLFQLNYQLQLFVLEKHKSLSVLKSLGFKKMQWFSLFFWLGNFLSLICIGLGLMAGFGLAYGLNPFIYFLERTLNVYFLSNQIGALS